jgi:hypothetical protein
MLYLIFYSTIRNSRTVSCSLKIHAVAKRIAIALWQSYGRPEITPLRMLPTQQLRCARVSDKTNKCSWRTPGVAPQISLHSCFISVTGTPPIPPDAFVTKLSSYLLDLSTWTIHTWTCPSKPKFFATRVSQAKELRRTPSFLGRSRKVNGKSKWNTVRWSSGCQLAGPASRSRGPSQDECLSQLARTVSVLESSWVENLKMLGRRRRWMDDLPSTRRSCFGRY